MARLSTFDRWFGLGLLLGIAILFSRPTSGIPTHDKIAEASLAVPGEIGQRGGRLLVALRAALTTLIPLFAVYTHARYVNNMRCVEAYYRHNHWARSIVFTFASMLAHACY